MMLPKYQIYNEMLIQQHHRYLSSIISDVFIVYLR